MNRLNYSKGYRTKKESVDAIAAVMRKVYAYMCVGLLISAFMAYIFAYVPTFTNLIYKINENGIMTMSFFGWIVLFSPLLILLFSGMRDKSSGVMLGLFFLISALMGASLSSIFLVYSSENILISFVITAGMFFVMSVYGYATNKDLSSWGSILFMCLIGLIIAMLVNLFLESSIMAIIISCVAVIVFTCLIAYDTQKIKEELGYSTNDEEINRVAAWGAFSLYLDFINLMLHILRLVAAAKGGRR